MPVHPVSNLAAFDKDVRNRHLVYDYDAKDENGNPEKWRYEIWFYNEVNTYILPSPQKSNY